MLGRQLGAAAAAEKKWTAEQEAARNKAWFVEGGDAAAGSGRPLARPEPGKAYPAWQQLTEAAGWQNRDSQGEVSFDGKLWILGGWFGSFESPPGLITQGVQGPLDLRLRTLCQL
jgi:hypothetical protein